MLHRTVLSRGVAAWLVVLVALPFTAPFATCDLAAPAHRAGADVRSLVHDDAILRVKVLPRSLLAGVPARNILSPFASQTATPLGHPTSRADRRQALHSVLRL